MNRLSIALIYIMLLYAGSAMTQNEFADVILESFYSGANPDFNNFYGNNGTTNGCNLFLTDPEVCLGDSDFIVCLPTGSSITVGFTDNLIFDAPGQDDLFVQEQGGGLELGEVWVSPDGIEFTFLDMLNGASINSYDLSDYTYNDVVKAVRVIGLDQGGCNPGLDLQRIFGVPGANCDCGADLAPFPSGICAIDTSIDLTALVLDSTSGRWAGQNVVDNRFNPEGLTTDNFDIYYLVNDGSPTCPVDTVSLQVRFADCDCQGVENGSAIFDSCNTCLLPDDNTFNDCIDCMGVVDGLATRDSCGICMLPSDPLFNASCKDCSGVVAGDAVFDLCGTCLLPTDPDFNLSCDEIVKLYLPNIFDLSNAEGRSIGPRYNQANLGIVDFYEIYDRWGNLVYAIYDTPLNEISQWWNGQFRGKDVNTGIYVFRMNIEFDFTEDFEFSGALTIIN